MKDDGAKRGRILGRARILRRWSSLCLRCDADPKAFQMERIYVEWESPEGRRETYVSQWCACPIDELYGPVKR